MKKSKIYILLSSFSKHEMNSLHKFLTSPFFNENTELIKLFEVISKKIASNKKIHENPDKEEIWHEVFSRQPYNDIRFRRLVSDLLQLSLDFMQVNNFFSNPVKKDIDLLSLLVKPELSKHFENILRRINNSKKDQKESDVNFFINQYYSEKYQYEFSSVLKGETNYIHFVKADYYLDSFYIKEKLNHFITSLIYGNIRAKELKIEILPGFLTYIKNSKYFEEPIIKILYKMTLLFVKEENDKQFDGLILDLEKYQKDIPKNELRDFYFNAQNFCAIKVNSGDVTYYKKVFLIHKVLVEKGLIGENRLEPIVYKNIITIGLRNKEFEWIELFIKNYTKKLPKENQENALAYNLANVYFHQKQYDKVVDQLREVAYKSHIYALGGKLMLLKTYYEMDEDRPLFSLIDSFSIYLRRNKFISKEVKQQYLNVLRFIRKIYSLAPYEKEKLQKIKEKVQGSKKLADKQWLLKKIEELE